MNTSLYYNPTKIIFGENSVDSLGSLLIEQKVKKVLIVYGGMSAIKSGLLEKVTNECKKNNINCTYLNGVIANPLLSKVYEGIEIANLENVDFILAVGGGSVIDTAKAVAVGMHEDGDVWDFFEGKKEIKGAMPIASILTIPAAGSEMSSSCVITNDEGDLKRSINSPYIICKFSILDPLLTLTLPNYQTSCGVVDIIMHTMERFFVNATTLELTDEISYSIIRTVIKNARILKNNPNDIEARKNILWAGSLSHNGLTNFGSIRGDWATHQIEHELSGKYNVAHGAGLSAIWDSWAKYVVNIIPKRFSDFAINVFIIENTGSEIDNALLGIEKMKSFFEEINMPTSLKGLKINPKAEDIEQMALSATFFNKRLVGTVKALDKEDIINILNNANK